MRLQIHGEGRALTKGSAHVAAKFVERKIRFLRRIRIARVPELVGKIIEKRTAVLVGAWLGENFDASESDVVVLG